MTTGSTLFPQTTTSGKSTSELITDTSFFTQNMTSPITSVTPIMTTTESTETQMQRTVILMERRTNDGEDLFIRGGIDHQHHPGTEVNYVQTDDSLFTFLKMYIYFFVFWFKSTASSQLKWTKR